MSSPPLSCGYATSVSCFYQGQWHNFILHPTRSSTNRCPLTLFKFGSRRDRPPPANRRLTPPPRQALSKPEPSSTLRAETARSDDSPPPLATLHDLGINVSPSTTEATGHSVGTHPNQLHMTQDAETLAIPQSPRAPFEKQDQSPRHRPRSQPTRQLTSHHPFCASQPSSSTPQPRPIADRFSTDPRACSSPVRISHSHDRFPLAEPLATLKNPEAAALPRRHQSRIFTSGASPKITVELPTSSTALYQQSITRFLDQYVPAAGPHPLQPATAGALKERVS